MGFLKLLFHPVIIAGIALRVGLFLWGFYDIFGFRKEIVTPLTDFKRVEEGLYYISKLNISPYSGDAFHQAPILLPAFYFVYQNKFLTQLIYVLADLLSALLLSEIVLLWQNQHLSKNTSPSAGYRAKNKLNYYLDRKNLNELVAMIYMFNPLTIMSCLGMSTIIFNNLSIIFALYFALSGNTLFSVFSISIATYLSLYPATLIFPLSLLVKTKKPLFVSLTLFLVFTGSLLGISFLLLNSWEFLQETYGFALTVPDLTPNIGVFWYEFTEIFKQYQNFFLFVYQYNAFIYAIPMYIRLKEHPMVMFWMGVAISAAFKSYPAVGDIALQASFAPLILDEIKGNRYGFIIIIVGIFVTVLAPIFWTMWIYSGTGNANFYYAISLVVTVAQVMFLIDSLGAVLKDDYLVKKEEKQKNVDPLTQVS